MKVIKIDNSKNSAIKSGGWSNPGAVLYDTLLDAFYCVGDIPSDAKELDKKIKEGKYIQWYDYLKEAYLVAPISKIKNSPYGRTPYSRSNCAYPHHVVKGDKLVVSIPGLKAAYRRACQMGILKGEMKEHLERHIKELSITASFQNNKLTWNESVEYISELAIDDMTDEDVLVYFDEGLDEFITDLDSFEYYSEADIGSNHGIDEFKSRWKYNENTKSVRYENRDFKIYIDMDFGEYDRTHSNIGDVSKSPAGVVSIDGVDSPVILVDHKRFWRFDADEQDAMILHEIGHIVCQQSKRPFPKSIKELLQRIKKAIQRLIARIRMRKYKKGIHGNPYHELEADIYAAVRTSPESVQKLLKNLYIKGVIWEDFIDHARENLPEDKCKALFNTKKGKNGFPNDYEGFKEELIKRFAISIANKYYQKNSSDLTSEDIDQRISALNNKKLLNNGYFKKESTDSIMESNFQDIYLYLMEDSGINFFESGDNLVGVSVEGTSLSRKIWDTIGDKTPEALHKWMCNNITYDKTIKGWKLKSPRETYLLGTGNCHDQSLFSVYMLHSIGYVVSGQIFFVECANAADNPDGNAHTLTYYGVDTTGNLEWNYYWFETTWDEYIGIHGPYDSLYDLKDAVVEAYKKSKDINSHDPKFNVLGIGDVGRFRSGYSFSKYIHSWETSEVRLDKKDKKIDTDSQISQLSELITEMVANPSNSSLCIESATLLLEGGKISRSKLYDTFLSSIETPEELNKFMDCIEYGFMTKKDGKIDQHHKKFDDEEYFYQNYYLQSPGELLETKIGVCWDQTELERAWFNHKGIPHAVVYIEILDGKNIPSHTFLVYETEEDYRWFEHSWEHFRGIHSFKRLRDLFTTVISNHQKFNNDTKSPVNVKLLTAKPSPPSSGFSCDDFMKYARNKPSVDMGDISNEIFNESGDYFKILKSDLDNNFTSKKQRSLSEFTRLYITNELAKKYKNDGKLVGMMRDQNPKYDDDCFIWIDENDDYVCAITYDSKPNKDGHTYISGIDVAYKYLGCGLGAQLLDFAIEHGVDALNCQFDNSIALKLYLDHGFEISEDSKKRVADGVSSIYDLYLKKQDNASSVNKIYNKHKIYESTDVLGDKFYFGSQTELDSKTISVKSPRGLILFQTIRSASLSGLNKDAIAKEYFENILAKNNKEIFKPKYTVVYGPITSSGDNSNPLTKVQLFHDVPSYTEIGTGSSTVYLYEVDIEKVKYELALIEGGWLYRGTTKLPIRQVGSTEVQWSITYSNKIGTTGSIDIKDMKESVIYECGIKEGQGIDGDDLAWLEQYLLEEGEIIYDPYVEKVDNSKTEKNGNRRKELYIAFIEWCKEFNDKNIFGSIFDKDAFTITYPFIPNEMRYFYRLANPLLCVLDGDLTFFQASELKEVNEDNHNIDKLIIFAATPEDFRVFNIEDKKVYKGVEENNSIVLKEVLGETFDLYIQNMIGKGDILNKDNREE